MDWHTKRFASAAELRKLAAKHEALAQAAEAEGDRAYAVIHKEDAAAYRDAARTKEYEAR